MGLPRLECPTYMYTQLVCVIQGWHINHTHTCTSLVPSLSVRQIFIAYSMIFHTTNLTRGKAGYEAIHVTIGNTCSNHVTT